MGEILRYTERDNKNNTKDFIIELENSYIYDDVNNIDENIRKYR